MFVDKDSMFTVSLSDEAGLKYFHCKNKEETIQYEASVMCEPGAWSSFMCLVALASVIKCDTYSYYPEGGNQPLVELFNCDIVARVSQPSRAQPKFHVLWSRSGNLDNTPDTKYQPNHFVPLLNCDNKTRDVLPDQIKETTRTSVKKQIKIASFSVKQSSEKVFSRIPVPTKSKSTMKWKANSDDETEKSHPKHLSSQIPVPKPSVTSPKRKAVSDDENDVDKPKPKHMSPQIIVTEVSSASKERTASFTDGGGMEKAKEKHVSSKLPVPSSYSTSMKQKTSADNRSDPEKSEQKCVNRGLPIHRKEDVNVKDIGLHYEDIEKLSDNEIYDLMLHHWKPGKDFSFPRTTEASGEKHFLIKHLDAFSWLAYSQYLDGCFCIPFLLFGRKTGHRVAARLKKLFTEPYTYWTSACSGFKDHEQRSAVHKDSVLIVENF